MVPAAVRTRPDRAVWHSSLGCGSGIQTRDVEPARDAPGDTDGGDGRDGDVGGVADNDVRSVGCCVVDVPDKPASVAKAGGSDEVLCRGIEHFASDGR